MKTARLLLYPIAIFALVVNFLSTPAPAYASPVTWTVKSKGDGAANPANCPGASCRLRDAIAKASSGDIIKFAVTGTITLQAGPLSINNEDLTITGPGATNLTIDGNNGGRIFSMFGAGTVRISGLKLQHGLVNDANSGPGTVGGGAVLVYGPVLNLSGMVITNNTVNCVSSCTNGLNGGGGGVAASTGSALSVANSTISNNTASHEGGGVFFNSGTSVGEDVTLTNVSVTGNHALDATAGDGGGIAIGNHHAATLTGVTVSSNTAAVSGGGLLAPAPVTISNSTFASNQANGGSFEGGGAIFMSGGSGTFSISRSTISGNTSLTGGGGIMDNTGVATISESTIKNNTDSASTWGGGGIFLMNGQSLTLSNSTLSGNSTGGGGGAIWIGNPSTLTAWNDTMTANTDGDVNGGGAIFSQQGTLILYNSTLAGNTATSGHGGALFAYNATTTLANDILANSTGGASDCAQYLGTLTNVYATNFILVDDANACNNAEISKHTDPMLGPLADNGGPTQTMALHFGSDAIDNGDSGLCASSSYANGRDQRGAARPTACDIGAFEYYPQLLLNPSFEIDANNDHKPDSFKYTNWASGDKRDCIIFQLDSCSLKLKGTGIAQSAVQTVMKSGSAGDIFTYSLWSKASGVPVGSLYRLQVRFYNGASVVATKNLNFKTGNHPFKQVSGAFTVPAAYNKVTFKIQFTAISGTAWFDNAELH